MEDQASGAASRCVCVGPRNAPEQIAARSRIGWPSRQRQTEHQNHLNYSGELLSKLKIHRMRAILHLPREEDEHTRNTDVCM
jgi:hypothetical protein